MTEMALCTSQDNHSSTRAASPENQDGEGLISPLLQILPTQTWSKPRKAPTITPRSFNRFFTPQSTFERGGRIGASRKALRDITALGVNRKGRRTPSNDRGKLNICFDTASMSNARKRKRYAKPSAYPSPDFSSPSKRGRKQSPDILADDDTDDDFYDNDKDNSEITRLGHSHRTPCQHVHRILPSKCRGHLGEGLHRETGSHIQQMGLLKPARSSAGSDEYQYETADLYSKPEDAHCCYNISTPSAHTIPFCTASCNTNSLVAIGDEDGGVRLLESARDEKPGFSKPWLTFRPHTNAILDLGFSPDDLRLATASGDQTSKIIDMPSQRVLYTMADHYSSVKQVRFQPESSDVLATSSRDGNIQIWDLRCKGLETPVRDLLVPVNSNAMATRTVSIPKMTWARSVNTIFEAHATRSPVTSSNPPWSSARRLTTPPSFDAPSRTEIAGRRGDVSITSLAFLPAPRSYLLLSGSEADASVKVWDLRLTYNQRRSKRAATPLSSTKQPESHNRHRDFGLSSLSLSGDSTRLYTLCRDNTVYAYSVQHLMLGSAPELSISAGSTMRPKRYTSSDHVKEGLGPLYGFRHPSFHATTFYVSSAVRSACADRSELLAVGSGDGCAVVFPTNERYMKPHRQRTCDSSATTGSVAANPRHRRGLTRTDSGLSGRLNDTIPIYQQGTALVRGHSREVTGLTWTKAGELVTVGDDSRVRCWRETDREMARELRLKGESGGRRWGCGWAEVEAGWDDDDE